MSNTAELHRVMQDMIRSGRLSDDEDNGELVLAGCPRIAGVVNLGRKCY